MRDTTTRNLIFLIIGLAIAAGALNQLLDKGIPSGAKQNTVRIQPETFDNTTTSSYENPNVGLDFEHPTRFVVEPSSTRQNYFINLIPKEVYEEGRQSESRYVNEYVMGFTFYHNNEDLEVGEWLKDYIRESGVEVSEQKDANVAGQGGVSFVVENEGINLPGDMVYAFRHPDSGDIVLFFHVNDDSTTKAADIILNSIEFSVPEMPQAQ